MPAYRRTLAETVYGVSPDARETTVAERKVLDASAFGGKGVLTQYRLTAKLRFGSETVDVRDSTGEGGFYMTLITPKNAQGPVPIILMETFCPRWNALPHPAVARPADTEDMGGPMFAVATYVFGRYICTPPIETVLDAGYALAAIHPGDVVPDDKDIAPAELARLAAGHNDPKTRWGAVAAWASVFSMGLDALAADPAIDQEGLILWGHSRYAKAALLAAAHDERVDAVIAHQSGTGGAALNRNKKGESVKSITKNYPHWFANAYADYAEREGEMPIDQHMLLAVVAPRPLFLGNARRDVWSDPNGSFRAALGANPAYQLYGRAGLTQNRLSSFIPGDAVAFWMRPGTHGVTEEDWPAFLTFLDAHFSDRDAAS